MPEPRKDDVLDTRDDHYYLFGALPARDRESQRVRIGPFPSSSAAESYRNKLAMTVSTEEAMFCLKNPPVIKGYTPISPEESLAA